MTTLLDIPIGTDHPRPDIPAHGSIRPIEGEHRRPGMEIFVDGVWYPVDGASNLKYNSYTIIQSPTDHDHTR